MSDKSSDIEDWAFVDRDGEIELSDEGSSASSIEVVNVENDVVTYQNRRSLERSISPTFQHISTVDTENGTCTGEGLASSNSMLSASMQNQENILAKDSLSCGNDEKVDISKQELLPLNSSTEGQPQITRELSVPSDNINVTSIQSIPSDLSENSSDADSDYIRLESESLDGDNLDMISSSVSSNFNFISRENSPLTEDIIGDKIFEGKSNNQDCDESQEPDSIINPCESIRQGSDVSDDNNQNLADINDVMEDDVQNIVVDNLVLEGFQNPVEINASLENEIQDLEVNNQVLEAYNQNPVDINERLGDMQQEVVDNHVLEDNNQNLRDRINLENEDLSDIDQNDQSAEVEEDQDRYTDSGTEDDRIESDQSDAGSIPPLDDDMSFVNDIGDLPLVAGDVARQYVHNPNRHLNLILDVIAILMFAVVLGLGIGHAIATFEEIEEYETLHSNIASLRSQALTCQNQKWSQKVTINDLRLDQENLNIKYKESKAEQEKLRILNTLLHLELETFRKHETSINGHKDIRLKLQNEINQLKTEKEELKQIIGQLKYTTHPANKNIGNTDSTHINKDLCDKSASDTKAALKYQGKILSDYSLDDLQEIHNLESLDNSLLKQEVGRLRYTSHAGSKAMSKLKFSKEEAYVDTEHQKIMEGKQCENVSALKEELGQAQHNAEIWYKKYIGLKERNQLNSTNCFKYIISNLNATQFLSSVNTTIFKTWLASSGAVAKNVQNVFTEVGSKVWQDVSRTSQEIFQIMSDEFQMYNDDTPDLDSNFADDDTDLTGDARNLAGDETELTDENTYVTGDDTDLAGDETHLTGDDTDLDDDDTELPDDDDADLTYEDSNLTDDDITDQNINNNHQENKKRPSNEADAEMDSESSNDTKEHTNHHAKWSDNVKNILNKTRHKMSNVSQQIKDTWLQVKNLSHQFWAQHEGKVTKTLTKLSNKVANFGEKIKDKLKRKVSRWYKKDEEKQRNKQTLKRQKSQESSEEKKKTDKGHKHLRNKQHDKKLGRKSKRNEKQQKHQVKQSRKFLKQAKFQEKKQVKSEKKLEKIISKYEYRMSNKMNNVIFKKLNDHARQSELNKIYHIQSFAAELGFYSDKQPFSSNIENGLKFLNCQDLWWSSMTVKDMPTDYQILHCSQVLPDWQMKKLLKRRRLMLIEGRLIISDEKTEKEIVHIQKNFDIHNDGNQIKEERVHQIKEKINSDDTVLRAGESADWQFQRAHDREELRQRESKPDWLFERANHRKESREEDSEPDWLFERAKYRKDLRYKEWEEPEWTFTRAKHREEVREGELQPDKLFGKAHVHEKLRDHSSRSRRRQRHSSRVIDCLG